MTHEYSQGIAHDGAAILKDGQPMTIDEIVAELRVGDAAQAENDRLRAVTARFVDLTERDVIRVGAADRHLVVRLLSEANEVLAGDPQ